MIISLLQYALTLITSGLSIEFERAYYPVTEGDRTVVNVVLSNQYTTAFLVQIVPERTGGQPA